MQKSKSESFRELHWNNEALVLVNVWDPASAAIVEKSGLSALATSSASLAWANGYADGSALPRNVLLSAVSRILRVSKLPLTVDIEDGYSRSPEEVAELAADLTELGVVGINVEDGTNAPELLAEKLSAIRARVEMRSLFINARTDVYLQELVEPEMRLEETINRLRRYIESGADGVFVPGLTNSKDISAISSSFEAPLNIMIASYKANFRELKASGASRISVGPNSFIDTYAMLPKLAKRLVDTADENTISYDYMNSLFQENLRE